MVLVKRQDTNPRPRASHAACKILRTVDPDQCHWWHLFTNAKFQHIGTYQRCGRNIGDASLLYSSVQQLPAIAAACVTPHRSWRSEATRRVGRVVSAPPARYHEHLQRRAQRLRYGASSGEKASTPCEVATNAATKRLRDDATASAAASEKSRIAQDSVLHEMSRGTPQQKCHVRLPRGPRDSGRTRPSNSRGAMLCHQAGHGAAEPEYNTLHGKYVE
jgi:hypothetical protein